MNAQQQALDIIKGEHRALVAVIDALKHVADDMALGKLTPDYKLLWSIIYYIDEFPEAMHHPKEDEVLFPRICARSHELDATLDDLTRQHASSRPHLESLKNLLVESRPRFPARRRSSAPRSRPMLRSTTGTWRRRKPMSCPGHAKYSGHRTGTRSPARLP